MLLTDLIASLDELLSPASYRDYAPNGLQVEGRAEVRRVVTGVSACLALIERAAARQADLLLVHHGWFWRGEDPRLVSYRGRRVRALLRSEMSLAAYHLPLDGHPEIGNNAQLGRALGFTAPCRFGEQELGCWGETEPLTGTELARRVSAALGRDPLLLGPGDTQIRRVAWCSGAAQDMIDEAIALGCDAFLSGEVSERTTHAAREAGICYLACGHHATERLGPRALGQWIAERHGLAVEFIDVANPV